MTVYTIYASTTGGAVYTESASTYLAAADGTGAIYSADTGGHITVGQMGGGSYGCYEQLIQFDTALLSGATVNSVSLSKCLGRDYSFVDFVENVRLYDWSGSASDFRNPDQLSSLPLLATLNSLGISGAFDTYKAFTSEALFPTCINTAGVTSIICSSSRHESRSVPSDYEILRWYGGAYTGTTRDPYLTVDASYSGPPSLEASAAQSITTGQSSVAATSVAAQVSQGIAIGGDATASALIAATAPQPLSMGQDAAAQAAVRSLSRVGYATGTNTATMPAHQAGDIIIVFAFRDGNTTAPSLPASPIYQSAGTRSGTSCSGRVGYRIATSSSETVGTWTNATSVVVVVYRATTSAAVGAVASNAGTTNTLNYPTVTLQDSGGTSWVAGFVGHRSTNQAIETPPSGMTAVADVVDTTDEAAAHDTNAGVTAWSSTNRALSGTASGWVSFVVEIKALPIISAAADQSVTVGQDATAAGQTIQAAADQPVAMGQSAAAAATVNGLSDQSVVAAQSAVATDLVRASASHQVDVAQTVAGAVLLTAQSSSSSVAVAQDATATLTAVAAATQQVAVAQAAAAALLIRGTADQALGAQQQAAGAVRVAGDAAQAVTAGQSAAAATRIAGTAAGALLAAQGAVARVLVAASAAQAIGVSQSAVGGFGAVIEAMQAIGAGQSAALSAIVSAAASQPIGAQQAATAQVRISASADQRVDIAQSVVAVVRIVGGAISEVAVSQTVMAVAPITAAADQAIGLNQVARLIVTASTAADRGQLILRSQGRVRVAVGQPRHRILTAGRVRTLMSRPRDRALIGQPRIRLLAK